MAHTLSISFYTNLIKPYRLKLNCSVFIFISPTQINMVGYYYPFTAPIVIPFTKNFCTNGYNDNIGITEITIVE